MWRSLPQQGAGVREVRIEGTGRHRDVVIVPDQGERLRLLAKGTILVETAGYVVVRSEVTAETSLRVCFTGEGLLLDRAEVDFDGNDWDWESLWRRARMRSRPWWREVDAEELDLDWAMHARIRIVGASNTMSF